MSTSTHTEAGKEHPRSFPARLRSLATSRLSRVPLRSRLIAITVALVLAAQAISVFATSFVLQHTLQARLDDELRTAVIPTAEEAAVAIRGVNGSGTRVLSSLPTTYAVVFWSTSSSAQKTILPTTESEVPKIPRLTLDSPELKEGRIFEVQSVDGDQSWRVLAGKSTDQGTVFAVAVSERGITRTVQQVALLGTMFGVLAALACLLAGWFLVNRAFRPLHRIEDTAAAIAAGDLTRRVPVRRSSDEIESLSRSLNAMLNRIEASFTAVENSEGRMRQFVADASHELRTPLVTVRGYAELYRQGAVSQPEQVGQIMGRIEGEATRMSGLVEDLLALARLDEQRPMSFDVTDLTVVAVDAVQDARAVAPGRRVRAFGLDGQLEPALVLGDESKLRQVLANLVANALNHTPPGTPIEVGVGQVRDLVRVEIRDHGGGIPADEAPHVFERFYRQDRARTRGEAEQGGSGLGLAIVAAIVAAHRGRVGVSATPGGGATFTVELPSHPTAPPQEPKSVP